MSTSPFAAAIARLEGYGPSGNIPTLANNPGSLELGDLGYGTYNAANGQQITVFPTAEDGWSALQHQLDLATSGRSQFYSPDTTLDQFGTTYSGGNSSYGKNLAKILGVSPDTTLSGVQNSTTNNYPWYDPRGPLGSGSAIGQSIGKNIDPRGPLGNAVGNFFWANFYTSRALILIIGLLLIGAALFSFKQTQTVIKTAAKLAA